MSELALVNASPTVAMVSRSSRLDIRTFGDGDDVSPAELPALLLFSFTTFVSMLTPTFAFDEAIIKIICRYSLLFWFTNIQWDAGRVCIRFHFWPRWVNVSPSSLSLWFEILLNRKTTDNRLLTFTHSRWFNYRLGNKKSLSKKGRQRKPVTGAMHWHVARPTS